MSAEDKGREKMHFFLGHDQEFCLPRHVTEARLVFGKVAETGMNTFVQVRVQIPSGLNIEAWKTYLEKYAAKQIVQFFQSLIRITSKQTQNYNSERSRGFWGDCQFILSF